MELVDPVGTATRVRCQLAQTRALDWTLMKIAMVSMHTSPSAQPGSGDAGGMNVYILSLASQLARRGVHVDIFTRATRPRRHYTEELAPGLRVINIIAGPFEGLAKEDLPTQLTAFAGGILAFVRAEYGPTGSPYDLIHSHYWLSGQVAWLLRDVWQLPWVHTAHTLAAVKNAHLSPGDIPETEARRICEQQLVDNADVLVVNTPQEAEELHRHYDAPSERISVVFPGADIELFSPGTHRNTERSRRELGIPLHTKVVAFVGRLQKFKGPDILIEACGILVRDNPQRQLSVLICGGASGGNSTVADYERLAQRNGLGSRVRFLAARPAEELVAVYQAADIVAVPSYNESFGLVALEAQACGTPVIAARVGGLPLAVSEGHTGLLVDGHDPKDWATALMTLLDDDQLRNTMASAAHRHAANFSWAASEAMLHALYQELIEGHAGAPELGRQRYGGGKTGERAQEQAY